MTPDEIIGHGRDRAHFAGGGKVGALAKIVEGVEGFPEYEAGLKKMIQNDSNLQLDHPAVKALADTGVNYPAQYEDHLGDVADFHNLTPEETKILSSHAKQYAGTKTFPKDPLEQIPWEEPIDLPASDEHSYIPAGSKILTGVDMESLADASKKNAAKIAPLTDQASRIIQTAKQMPDTDYKTLLQHYIQENSDLFGKYQNRTITNPGGGGYYTIGKGTYGTNDPKFLELMQKYGYDPMLDKNEYGLMRNYSAGHYSQSTDTDPEHEALNNLIQQYGIQTPSDTTLYKGMYPHTAGKQWDASEQWHNPTSYSTDESQAKFFMPGGVPDRTLVRLHNPGQMLPMPISGESELVLPGGAAGRLKILEKKFDPDLDATTVDAERYPFSEYAEGGLTQAQQQKMGDDSAATDPTDADSLKTLARWARNFGGPEHADDRARLIAGAANNFYGLDQQGKVSLLRSHQPGVIDQFLAMPGGMAHLAGLVAQAGGASKWNPLHSMMPDSYDAGTQWLLGAHPTSDAASERLQQLHAQVADAMQVPEAHGLKENVLDAAGMLASPIPGSGIAKYSPKLQRLLEMAGPVAPPTLKRYIGDSASFGAMNSAPEAIAKLKARLEAAQQGPDPEAQEEAPDAYGEGGKVLDFLKSMMIHVPHEMPGESIEEKTHNTIAQGFATQRRARELLDPTNTDLQPALLSEALSGDLNTTVTPEDMQKAQMFTIKNHDSSQYQDGSIEHHVTIGAPVPLMHEYQTALSEIE